jgi:chromosome segregation ATPase
MPEPDSEMPTTDDRDPTEVQIGTSDLDSEVEDALRTLREALDSSRQLSAMIADLEQKLAERKAQPSDAACSHPETAEQSETDTPCPREGSARVSDHGST